LLVDRERIPEERRRTEAALRGCMKATSLPVGVSFTFDSGAGGVFTMMGVTVAQAHEMAARNGAAFVGANCGRGIETFLPIAEQFAACGGALPIWIKGNAGLPERDASGNIRYNATPAIYAAAVEPLLAAGAKFIGGCCGSTPEHIRAIAQAIKARR
jgi:5-methyltetrahydrofolate--homocysteine methyltransferase